MLSNSKQANRTSSGKFITIYPADGVATQRVITELDKLVAGADGPYILSDVRWNRGPLYLRYGRVSAHADLRFIRRSRPGNSAS